MKGRGTSFWFAVLSKFTSDHRTYWVDAEPHLSSLKWRWRGMEPRQMIYTRHHSTDQKKKENPCAYIDIIAFQGYMKMES